MAEEQPKPQAWRRHLVFLVMLAAFALLGLRVVHLQTAERERLREQGDARYLRELSVAPARGRILDRNGRALAISTPVATLWAEPPRFCARPQRWEEMLKLPDITVTEKQLRARCARRKNHGFMYVQRRLPPRTAELALQLAPPGLSAQREYKRYYPNGPAGAHLVGFTDLDDIGQEGLEGAYQSQLAGVPGRMRGFKDRSGNYVESVESIRQVRHGGDLVISIDQRVQAMAADYLEAAVHKHRARGGSVVAIGVPSGEILGMVNSPQFNPNNRATLDASAYRNRSVTDLIEPGSTVKPFSVAMALESGKVRPETMVETAPGKMRLGSRTISDVRNFGEIPVIDVIAKSSNVGVAKLALEFPYDDLFGTFAALGFGKRAGGLPGEVSGVLERRPRRVDHATLAYGYGMSVTPLQLARAYTVFATDGELLPLTLARKPPGYRAPGTRVFGAQTASEVREMLGRAVSLGTARRARIPRYHAGGKTGTTRKLIDGEYSEDHYISVFAGLAPLDAPRFVVVVTLDDPRGKFYYGGDVAAPVFAKLMRDLMRLYNIKPDAAGSI
ncbi:MAG: penicillin-binding protein 2 [Gammaproteobacteria bacterium]|nr:penicillin-binding protein 2 [Gammaproteobacteria bacterium]MDA8023544.1 penicillin-binding protein 2 [Gammaproteobacteria bacterium]